MRDLEVVEQNGLASRSASDDRRKVMQLRRGIRRNHSPETDALWQRVAKAAVALSYQPAEERVRVVKTAFAIAGLVAKCQHMGELTHLLFDSFSHAPLAGMRSASTHLRQLLFRAEPYQIDLQIELDDERNRFIVTGQLADLSHPELFGRDVPITLSNRRENVVNVITNQFGEFRAEVENTGDLELSFLGRAGNPIIILLRGALDQSSGDQE